MAACKDLPDEILIDILAKLPLKSLIRFKAVSKPWLNFITFSKFPYWLFYKHLSCNPMITCPHNQSGLILSCLNLEGSSKSKILAMGGGQEESSFNKALELDFPPLRGKSYEIKTASCHGMLCLAVEDDNSILLWNLAIGEHKSLLVPPMEGFIDGVCGLGFDVSMDDYKIVSVYEKQLFVFSVKKKFWKNLGNISFNFFQEGISANGCLYWAASLSRRFGNRIVSLNLENYTVREVSLPPFNNPPKKQEKSKIITEFSLLQWGDSLCAFRHYDRSLWVLKEVKENGGLIKDNWTKMMQIPKLPNNDYSHCRVHNRLQPKCFTKTGKLLVAARHKSFVLYDGIKYNDLHVSGLRDLRYSKAIVYTESLISPHSIRSINDID